MLAELGILNVGAGDTKLVFDPGDPEGMKRAARVVADMIKRGYAVLVQVGEQVFNGRKEPIYRRAMAFDEKTFEYIIAGVPEEEKEEGDGRSAAAEAPAASKSLNRSGDRRGMHKRVTTQRIPAARASGVSVGRTAGG